jgi:uncharacterized SAM-binding protein YcdF (DUF218 family)
MLQKPNAVRDDRSAPKGAPPRSFPRRVMRQLRRTILSFCLVVALAGGIGFVWFLSRVPIAEPTAPERADGIVALTGGASRVNDAVELLAFGYGRRLLITGVYPSTSPREIARHVPQYEDIFTCCVDLDRSAVNTLGNATEARRWAHGRGFRSLIVVTSAYHMPRAMAELRHQLPEVKLIPFPVVTEKMQDEQWWSDPATARLLLSEYAKFILAVARMWINPDAQGVAAEQISTNVPDRAPPAGAEQR